MTDRVSPSTDTRELIVDYDGNLIVPRDLLLKAGIPAGESVSVYLTDAGLLIAPLQLHMPDIAAEATMALQDTNTTLEDLLKGLDQVKRDLYREQFGEPSTD